MGVFLLRRASAAESTERGLAMASVLKEAVTAEIRGEKKLVTGFEVQEAAQRTINKGFYFHPLP